MRTETILKTLSYHSTPPTLGTSRRPTSISQHHGRTPTSQHHCQTQLLTITVGPQLLNTMVGPQLLNIIVGPSFSPSRLDPNFSTSWSDPNFNCLNGRQPNCLSTWPKVNSQLFFKIFKFLGPSLPGMTSFTLQPHFLSGVYYDNCDCHIFCAQA